MAKKKARGARKAKASTRERKPARRSPEELIADLKAKIKDVELRAQAQELQKTSSLKRTLSIIRSIDKALEEAEADGNNHLRHALVDGRKPLAEFMTKKGVRLPKARVPRGRKPKY
jgi:hypothetical protein